MNHAQALRFRLTLDSLKPASVAYLIDLADGYPVLPDIWMYDALAEQGLVVSLIDLIHEWRASGEPFVFHLTDFGRDFVAWMRAPREIPQQLDLF